MRNRMILASCALVLFVVTPAAAQVRDAGSKIRGDAYSPHSAQSYGRAAYSHAETLDEFSRRYSYIPSERAKEHSAEVRRNVTAAKKEISKLAPKAKDDKKLAAHLDTLHKHYDKVLEHCTNMEGECAKDDKADGGKVGNCCASMTDSLKAAEAEHKKLSEHLKSAEKK